MVTIEDIKQITQHPQICEFAAFVISEWGDAPFPNHKKIDLIKVPSLVKCVWKVAYRQEDHLLMPFFSGSEIDNFWNFDLTKNGPVDDLWEDKRHKEVVPDLYEESIQKGQVSYTRRKALIRDGLVPKTANVEAILFPTSTDGQTPDSGMGYVDYYSTAKIEKNEYWLLGEAGWEIFETG